MEVKRQGEHLAVDEGPLPQHGLELVLGDAVLREPIDVPRIEQTTRGIPEDAGEVHHGQVGRSTTDRGHGELRVVRAAPGEHHRIDLGMGQLFLDGLHHALEDTAITPGEQVPQLDGDPVPRGDGGAPAERSRPRQGHTSAQ